MPRRLFLSDPIFRRLRGLEPGGGPRIEHGVFARYAHSRSNSLIIAIRILAFSAAYVPDHTNANEIDCDDGVTNLAASPPSRALKRVFLLGEKVL
jgi:hypothetical protein